MRVGYTMDLRNPSYSRRPWREIWEDSLYLMQEAEAMGFDFLQVQEHFFTEDGYGPSMPIFLALLCERTSRARLMAYLYVLTLHNPAQLAQETAVLDHLSGGRLEVAVGLGHRAVEYQAFGVDTRTRGARMEESLDALKAAWTGQPFTHHGRFFDFEDLEVRPEPLQKPYPPLWVGATTPRAAARAGRHGAGLCLGRADHAVVAAYLGGREETGLNAGQARIAFGVAGWPTYEDPDQVWARNGRFYEYKRAFYDRIRTELHDPELFPTRRNDETRKAYENIGPPELIVEQARATVEALQVTDFTWGGPPPGVPLRTEAYQGLKLFADEVLPVIHSW